MSLLDFAPANFRHLNKEQERIVKELLLREDFRKAVRQLRAKYKLERLSERKLDDMTAAILFSRVRDSELGEAIFWMMGDLKIPFSELFVFVCLLIKHDVIWKPQIREEHDSYPSPSVQELQQWERKFKRIDALFSKNKSEQANKLIRRFEKVIYRTDRITVSLQYRHVRMLLMQNARQEDIYGAWKIIDAYQKFFREQSQRAGDFDFDAKLLLHRENGLTFPQIADAIRKEYRDYLMSQIDMGNMSMSEREKIWIEVEKKVESKFGTLSDANLRVKYSRMKKKGIRT